MSITLTYTCPRCAAESDFEVTIEDARLVGPPEDCSPGGVEVNGPEECPSCKLAFDLDRVVELADEERRSPPERDDD